MRLVYIDENGNEIPVSGRPTSAENLPIEAGSSKMTSEAIGDLSQLTTTDKSSLVGAVNEVNNSSLKLLTGTGSGSGTSYSFPTGGSTNGSWLVSWGGAYVGFVTIFSTTVTITKIAGSTSITATASVSGNNCNITLSGVPYNALKYAKVF